VEKLRVVAAAFLAVKIKDGERQSRRRRKSDGSEVIFILFRQTMKNSRVLKNELCRNSDPVDNTGSFG